MEINNWQSFNLKDLTWPGSVDWPSKYKRDKALKDINLTHGADPWMDATAPSSDRGRCTFLYNCNLTKKAKAVTPLSLSSGFPLLGCTGLWPLGLKRILLLFTTQLRLQLIKHPTSLTQYCAFLPIVSLAVMQTIKVVLYIKRLLSKTVIPSENICKMLQLQCTWLTTCKNTVKR